MMAVPTKKRIYLVDDEADIRALVCEALEEYGFEAMAFASGQALRQAIQRHPPDLCLVDLGLPDMDGLALVRALWEDVRFGVVILTGRAALTDRVLGLELGADDYIVKPFIPRELVARVRTVIRRREQLLAGQTTPGLSRASFAGWIFDPGTLALNHNDGRQECLSAAEAALLSFFLRAPHRLLSREQLQKGDSGRDDLPFDRSIDVRISRIRKKIEQDPREPQIIRTVYGAGYIFSADVIWRA